MEKRLNKLSKWGVVLVNIALYIAAYKVYVLIHDKGINPYIIYVLLILMIVEVVVQLLKYTQQQWTKHVLKKTKDESKIIEMITTLPLIAMISNFVVELSHIYMS
ncbi:MAG: hypothetical protein Q4E84_00175 [Clostridia bacterium]|nr:hypothetical protein [Clostridia bacterium]